MKAKSNSSTKIQLTWYKEWDVKGYQIYDTVKKKVVKTVSGNSATITGLKENTVYQYKVRAYRVIDGVTYYGQYSSKVMCSTSPRRVYASAYSKYKDGYRFRWNKAKGATGVEVLCSKTKNFTGKGVIKKKFKATENSYTYRNLKKGTYYVKLRSYKTYINEEGLKVRSYSAYSPVYKFTLKKNL